MSATGKSAALQPPPNMITVQVVRRETVGHDAISFFVALPRTQRAPAAYLPGQFVTLAVPTPTETLYRSYSLCGAGSPNEPWEITVKRVKNGTISTWLFEKVPVGSLLYVSQPRGTFVLPSPLRRDVPLILVAAGSGITPLRGMIKALSQLNPSQRPQVQLHYASSSPEEIIYRQEFALLDPHHTWLTQWHYLSSAGQSLTPTQVIARAGANLRRAHWYVCGPDGLRHNMQSTLAQQGVPASQVHVEVFATQQAGNMSMAGQTRTSAAQMTIQETQAVLDVHANETLLVALERQGYQPDFSCRTGTCGTCKLRLLAGKVNPRGTGVLTQAELNAGYILSCIARPEGDVTLLSGGRPPVRGRNFVAASVVASQRSTNRTMVRATTVLALGGLLLGTWNLTNHYPASLRATAAGPVATKIPAPGATNTPLPGATNTPPSATDTPTATPVLGGNPTATPVLGGGGNPTATPAPTDTPVPTATPLPPPPTPTPVTCTTPSGHPC